MKKIIISLLLAVSLAAVAVSAEKPLGMEEFTSLSDLANTISSYFPKVRGEVTSVQGDLLTITVGTKDGLKSGVVLSLWRDGKEILHPVTGAVIGRVEQEVGDAEVIEVKETTSTVRTIKKLKEPRPGDKARITPKKISLALVPLRADRPEVIQELAERLNDLGRFSVLETEKVKAFLKDRKQRDSSLIKEMGRTFGLDVVAAIEIYPSEKGKLLMTVRMFYADDARSLDTITAVLDLTSKKDEFGEVRPFFAPLKDEKGGMMGAIGVIAGEKSVIEKLPLDVQLFAVADFEGTNTLQYVISDGSKLHIYRQESSGGWREEWKESGSFVADERQIINLDVADINGNGRPELFVTVMQNGKVISYVMEFREGAYRRIADVSGFLRIMTYPRRGKILIGQSYDPRSFYKGKLRQYVWSDGKYVPGEEFSLPKGVEIYGFAFAEMGETQPLLVALNDKEQLVVYSNNNAIWKSEEKYPAVGVTVNKPLTGADAILLKSVAGVDPNQPKVDREKVRIKGRVFALDVNGDGRDEIILAKNSGAIYLLSGYSEAEFVGLSWTGVRLEQRWQIKDVPGAILDFEILQPQGADAKIFALVNSPGGVFKKDTIQVISYLVK